jgi:uncharacterized membrane protein YqjE
MHFTKGIAAGFFEVLQTIAGAGIELLRERARLFAAELKAEQLRLFQTLLGAAAITAFGTIALVLLTVAIIFTCWDGARLQVLFAVAAVYGAVTVFLFFWLRKRIAGHDPLKKTLHELREDQALVTGGKLPGRNE